MKIFLTFLEFLRLILQFLINLKKTPNIKCSSKMRGLNLKIIIEKYYKRIVQTII